MPGTNLPTLTALGSRPGAWPGDEADGLALSPKLLDEFLDFLLRNSRALETVKTYRKKLYQLYEWLPEDKRIRWGTLEEWRKDLLDNGYAPRTVNLCISAANSLLEAHGRRELQLGRPLEADNIQPELTRSEYLRLLSTARTLGKEREYLMVKVFAAMGLSVRDLPRLTVEAAQSGRVRLPASVVHIPDCLREELLDFTGREGTVSGPVFVTQGGAPYTRNGVTTAIQRLCRDARVPESKANPRCLKKLYQTTQASIQANIALLVEQSHDRLLETEQLTIGWKREAAE